MNLNIGEHWEAYLKRLVETGRYNSASEIIRESLRLHEEDQRLLEIRRQELAKDINAGIASLERGEGVDGLEFMENLLRTNRGRSRRREAEG